MLKNKPELPKKIAYNDFTYYLEIFYNQDGECCISYVLYIYDNVETLSIGGNPILAKSKYIEDAWDIMLDILQTYRICFYDKKTREL